jgi:hypothetical protein
MSERRQRAEVGRQKLEVGRRKVEFGSGKAEFGMKKHRTEGMGSSVYIAFKRLIIQ